ncbi:MAG: PhoH family protein [Spirochaetia bacterium]|nr:PhoH family protein [Spirochaetia bacterium]
MEKEFTIVLPDPQILSQVCGTNDSNLRLIERHLGVSIFTRGNELSISDTSAEIRQEFKFIIDRLTDELSENGSDYGADGQELVESVLNTGFEKTESENFNALDFSISIPGSTRKIYPKTKNQARLVEAFRKSTMVFATGPAGCGKTFLAVAESLRLLLSHRVSSIILVRPIVEAGESLGFLPGDMQDKINPYLRPLYDSMSACIPAEILKKLQENGIIEAVPLAYMRGRTLNNAAVILDEAQNATCGQMKLFLTRIGENSKVFITGDVTQIDLPHRIPSGLVQALGILRNIEEISMVELDSEDVMRSPLVKKIVRAYENDKIE